MSVVTLFPDTTVKPEASRSDPLSWLKWNHSFCELVPLLPEEALSRGAVMTWPGHWSAGSFQIMTVMALEFFGSFTNPKLVLMNSGLNVSPLAQQSHLAGASGAMWVKIALELISCRALCSENRLMLFVVLASRSPDNYTPCKPPSLCFSYIATEPFFFTLRNAQCHVVTTSVAIVLNDLEFPAQLKTAGSGGFQRSLDSSRLGRLNQQPGSGVISSRTRENPLLPHPR